MRRLNDPVKVAKILKKYGINDMFDTQGLPFTVCVYEKGEQLNRKRSYNDFLQFMASGDVTVYYPSIIDETLQPVCNISDFTILGDYEFCEGGNNGVVVEANAPCLCIELETRPYKQILMNDTALLRTLLISTTRKMRMSTASKAHATSLESKIMYYLQKESPNGEICGVDATANHLQCSRRQLQRVLKELTDRNILEKTGKGTYRLINISE